MGRVAATFASTLCLLVGMTSLAIAKDGRGDDDRDDKADSGIERIEKHIIGKVLRSDYDGLSNDLLTAGLGATGLAGAAPKVANTASPTPEELRRLAIYNNYRALVDVTREAATGPSTARWSGPREMRPPATGRLPVPNIWRFSMTAMTAIPGRRWRSRCPKPSIPPMPAW